MVITHVKRAFKYRFHPTDAQANELLRTFGCVRKVYNLALTARTEAWARGERIDYSQTSAMLTAWKQTAELAYLGDVSSVPLQCEDPAVWHYPVTGAVVGIDVGLDQLVTLSTGEKVGNPRHGSADRARLAKAQRKPARKDAGSSNRDKARRVAVNRFFPSSKLCSRCGVLRSRMPLSVRSGAIHDRDVNAARNRLAAGLAVSVRGAGVRPRRNSSGRAVGGETESPPA